VANDIGANPFTERLFFFNLIKHNLTRSRLSTLKIQKKSPFEEKIVSKVFLPSLFLVLINQPLTDSQLSQDKMEENMQTEDY